MSDIETISPAAEAWLGGDMDKAQDLNRPIPDGPAVERLNNLPPFLENHLEVQSLEQKQNSAPAEASVADGALAKLTGMGGEHAEWVQRQGSGGVQKLENAFAGFKDIVTNRPELIPRIDASGLGNDTVLIDHLNDYWVMKSSFLEGKTVSDRRSSYDEPSRPLPSGNSAAQRELNQILKKSPPGSEAYRDSAVQDRVRQLNEMIYGTGPAIGQGGRTA